jgi:hypothetical protein
LEDGVLVLASAEAEEEGCLLLPLKLADGPLLPQGLLLVKLRSKGSSSFKSSE